jgi:hypothetical protein
LGEEGPFGKAPVQTGPLVDSTRSRLPRKRVALAEHLRRVVLVALRKRVALAEHKRVALAEHSCWALAA